MPVRRMDHAVLFVRNPKVSAAFYQEALGLEIAQVWKEAHFLKVPHSGRDHDLGLFPAGAQAEPSRSGRGAVGLYHLAWQVDTLEDLRGAKERLQRMGAFKGESNHNLAFSIYALDPDGIEFELCWIVPYELLTAEEIARGEGVERLDWDAVLTRFGARTPCRNA